MSRSSSTLYVGNLPGDIREREVDDLFYKVYFNTFVVHIFCCFIPTSILYLSLYFDSAVFYILFPFDDCLL